MPTLKADGTLATLQALSRRHSQQIVDLEMIFSDRMASLESRMVVLESSALPLLSPLDVETSLAHSSNFPLALAAGIELPSSPPRLQATRELSRQGKYENVCAKALPSFHTAVVHYAAHGRSIWQQFAWISAGFFVVGLQIICTSTMIMSSWYRNCAENGDCQSGRYCLHSRCQYCGIAATLVGSQNSSAFCKRMPEHNLCKDHGCFDPIRYGDEWNPFLWQTEWSSNLNSMGCYDYVSLAFAGFVIGLSVSEEAGDIAICQIAGFSDRFGCARQVSVWLMSCLRQYVVLPVLAFAGPNMVFYIRAGSLDIFFNALAVLFMLKIDDEIYANLMSESAKTDVQVTSTFDSDAARRLVVERIKLSYVVLISLGPFVYLLIWMRAMSTLHADFVTLICFMSLMSLPGLFYACLSNTIRQALVTCCTHWLAPAVLGILVAYHLLWNLQLLEEGGH